MVPPASYILFIDRVKMKQPKGQELENQAEAGGSNTPQKGLFLLSLNPTCQANN